MAHSDLRVTWYRNWNPGLDEALQALPEPEMLPAQLYRAVLQNPGGGRKIIALVTKDGAPAAMVGLRANGRVWMPVTQWITPGEVFPALPGLTMPVLEALEQDINFGYWRWFEGEPGSEPSGHSLRYCIKVPVHRICLSPECEAYWRENHFMKTIRSARCHSRKYTLVINHPGALDWTVRNWEGHWRAGGQPAPDLEDRLLVYHYLQERGKLFCFNLLDGDKIIAGNTALIHGGDLVAGVMFNDPEYRHDKIGHGLIDSVFTWAIQQGRFNQFDLGGDHEYKEHWAPTSGEKWLLRVCPSHLYYIHQSLHRLGQIFHPQPAA